MARRLRARGLWRFANACISNALRLESALRKSPPRGNCGGTACQYTAYGKEIRGNRGHSSTGMDKKGNFVTGEIDKKTKGAWVLHHAKKIQATTNQDFDGIAFAGKCGTLLSAMSGSDQATLTLKRVEALAKANHLSPKTELPAILNELARQKLIAQGSDAVEVLGLTGHSVLEHTTTIFEESKPDAHENAVITVSELASELPLSSQRAVEYISDIHKLSSTEARNTLDLGQKIRFFDAESISATDQLLFNGNLFRREDAKKVNAVLSSLKSSDAAHLTEVNAKLQEVGCLPIASVESVLGAELFQRLHSIGMFDVNMVGNESGKSYFVTRPAAFSKFTNSIADDALDLAKAFVASLTYGMTISSYYRGRIQMISLLMKKLIAGGTVGPATAIGSDYQVLEQRGVVRVRPADGGMFTMKLLKPDVGRLALAVIEQGNITAEAVDLLPGAKVTEYLSPETTREVVRKDSTEAVKINAKKLLSEIRTGGLSR